MSGRNPVVVATPHFHGTLVFWPTEHAGVLLATDDRGGGAVDVYVDGEKTA